MLQEVCKIAREEKDISNYKIAELSGLPATTVNKFFSAASKSPSIYTVGPICKALGVSIDEFFDITKPKQQEDSTEIAILREQSEQWHRQSILSHNAYLHARNTIVTLSITLAILLFFSSIYFIVFDILNPSFGIVKYDPNNPMKIIIATVIVVNLLVFLLIGVVSWIVRRTVKKFDL